MIDSFLNITVKVIIQAYREGVLLDTIFDLLVLLFEYAVNILYAVLCGLKGVALYWFKKI